MAESTSSLYNLRELDKQKKIAVTENKLYTMMNFLQTYLPLANVHSNNFILHNVWDTYLSDPIKTDIDRMSEDDVVGLQQMMLQYQMEENVDINSTVPSDSIQSCDYINAVPREWNQSKLLFPVQWKHDTVDKFIRDAARNSLPCSGLVCSLQEFKDRLTNTDDQSLVMSSFMTSKKSHEVNIMSEICQLMVENYGVDVIVDMGSGKGYLSTQLVYQHNLCVVAIDAQTSNTHGAQRRVNLLDKQWKALVQQAEEVRKDGRLKKKGKKAKKMLKQLENQKTSNASDAIVGQCKNTSDIAEEALADMQKLLSTGNVQMTKDEVSLASNCVVTFSPNCGTELCDKIDINDSAGAYVQNVNDNRSTNTSTSHKTLICSDCGKYFSKEEFSKNYKQEDMDIISGNSVCAKCNKSRNAKHRQLYYPLTIYVNDDVNVMDIVEQTGAFSGEATLMLTGLHTCGALGSSMQRLFVNNPNIKVLCYVGCCYHLMKEEFVMNPFPDEDGNKTPGFPMSSFLRKKKVGLGRHARNFASQTLYQSVTELKAKSFPRSLLQKILYDTLGYVDENWKGLRKLDQKCSDMHQYVTTAMNKLKLPSDMITPELVSDYVNRYSRDEKRLAMFLQIKSMLAPCIEAVILLDRYLYLLEQECTKDVLLVEMFDPVTSPRCHAIIAIKE